MVDSQLNLCTTGDREPSMFDHLCDNASSCIAMHSNALAEFYKLKDELLKHPLPPRLLLRLNLVASRIFRSYSDVCVPMGELMRLVRQYALPWEEKSTVLKKLKADYETKQRQLAIAVKQLELVAVEEERMQHERKLGNWMRLYTRVMATKSHGRRWKFRIEPFRKKLEDGFNPYESGSDEYSEDEDEDKAAKQSPLEMSDEELEDLMSGSEEKLSEISESLSSKLGATSLKKVRFAGMAQPPASPDSSTPPEAPPTVETEDASTWTGEPDYDNFLVVLLQRPQGILKGQDVCCGVALGDYFYTSEPFLSEDVDRFQSFKFSLSDDVTPVLVGGADSDFPLITPRLSITVYPQNIAHNMAAHGTIPLTDLILTEEPTTFVPPVTRESEQLATQEAEEDKEVKWSGDQLLPNWNELSSKLEIMAEPHEYSLRSTGNGEEASIFLICHWVKILRHKQIHTGTSTQQWDEMLEEMGYQLSRDVQSRGVSAMTLLQESQTTSQVKILTPEPPQEEKGLSAEAVEELAMKHTQELQQIQLQYEKKLEALSCTLAHVRADRDRDIKELEQALVESEASKGKRARDPSEIRALLSRRKAASITKGLPQWGKDMPTDFFERLELFAEESVRKHTELTEKIKKEVRDTCEKQLATLHRLTPMVTGGVDSAMEDVCLPALFMPTAVPRALIFNPRAHRYFHPPGSSQSRVTQPPSIFRMPGLNKEHVSTVNLYKLGQDFVQSGPGKWRNYNLAHQSPRYTPAPPPSACDFYRPASAPREQHFAWPLLARTKI